MVMADLSEAQRETLMTLIFQRRVDLHHSAPCSEVVAGESVRVTPPGLAPSHSEFSHMEGWMSMKDSGCWTRSEEMAKKDSSTSAKMYSSSTTNINASGKDIPSKAVPWVKEQWQDGQEQRQRTSMTLDTVSVHDPGHWMHKSYVQQISISQYGEWLPWPERQGSS